MVLEYWALPLFIGYFDERARAGARYDAGTESERLNFSISNYPLSLFVPLLPAPWALGPLKVTIPAE